MRGHGHLISLRSHPQTVDGSRPNRWASASVESPAACRAALTRPPKVSGFCAVVPEEGEESRQKAQPRRAPPCLQIGARLRAADLAGRMLEEAPTKARPPEMLAQGPVRLRVAGRIRLPSS